VATIRPHPARFARQRDEETGQALLLLVGLLTAALLGALVLGAVARGVGAHGDQQRAADLAALAGARAMQAAYPRLFEPALLGGSVNPAHLERLAYVALGRRAALATARRNGAHRVGVVFPDAAGLAPVRIRVTVEDAIEVRGGSGVPAGARAEAELVPPGDPSSIGQSAGPGEYRGPFAIRQGKPMRPDVALAFDRMAAAALADGIGVVITSAFRSDAEQARLFTAHPDPKWVAPPGQSLHRLGTELDLGSESAYGWLHANAARFHFIQRYAWEAWHYGYTLNPASAPAGDRRSEREGGDGERSAALQAFVPERFAPAIARAAQRWSVSAALLAAQLWRESKFNPFALSEAGARGIAQFMAGTARQYGLRDRSDPVASIDAQAHLMRDLLRQLGSVGLALAAYNAGPARVRACMCVPAIPETLAYVADILGLLYGAGDPAGAGAAGLGVRLVA
jgi:transglycosylase-like protein with SLT domain/D-alanyl-D-alanine carboxypeptidase-like protein